MSSVTLERYGLAAIMLAYIVAPMFLFGFLLKPIIGDWVAILLFGWPTVIAPFSLLGVLEWMERKQSFNHAQETRST
jgi:hypothetical protein